jgi:hypothetical protein
MSASSQQPSMGLGRIMIAATQKTRAIAKVMAKMEIHIRAPRVCAMRAVQFLAISAPSAKRFCPHAGCWFPSNRPRAHVISGWWPEFTRDTPTAQRWEGLLCGFPPSFSARECAIAYSWSARPAHANHLAAIRLHVAFSPPRVDLAMRSRSPACRRNSSDGFTPHFIEWGRPQTKSAAA